MPIFILLFLIQWVTVCFIVTALEETKISEGGPFIVIEPISSREYGLVVVTRLQDTLNLTCTVFNNSTDLQPRYNITWSLPISSTNSKNRVVIQSSANSVNLLVSHLETKDEGEYACTAQPVDGGHKAITSAVKVNIKNRKKPCGEAMFVCNLSKHQNCIHQRFKCDGHPDCDMGEDEDQQVCGESPCMDKLQCEDSHNSVVRCIPKSWCCNVRVDVNCTTREPLSCCPPSFHKTYMDERSYYATHQPHYTDMTILQTTIYTVIGCAMVFMIVVTVLVIAICRVHMKRTLNTQCPTQNTPLYDLDVYLTRPACTLDTIPPPGCLVTYNINNGVQIVGHAIDPPPYCEVMSIPPREGPPPPYTSHETLDQPESEALLQQHTTTSQSLRIGEEDLRRASGEQRLEAVESNHTSDLHA